MSGLFRSPTFRAVLITLIVSGALQLLSAMTGFGNWLRTTPAAIAVVRSLATLIFGGGAILILWGSRNDVALRSFSYRLSAFFLLLLATANAALLIGGVRSGGGGL